MSALLDEHQTAIEINGRIALANTAGVTIKDDCPLGDGIEPVDVPEGIGATLGAASVNDVLHYCEGI
jgi:hypothetical protein